MQLRHNIFKWNTKISDLKSSFPSLQDQSVLWRYHLNWLKFLFYGLDLPLHSDFSVHFHPFLHVTYLTFSIKSSEVLPKSFVIPSPWLCSWFTAPIPSGKEENMFILVGWVNHPSQKYRKHVLFFSTLNCLNFRFFN